MGGPTYLETKVEGESSMSVKRSLPEGGYGAAPQDPRDMVRARLPEPQFPVMQYHIPRYTVYSEATSGSCCI